MQQSTDFLVISFVQVSDANLSRYGIKPSQLKEELTKNSQVNAYIIFIASMGEEAQYLKESLPVGRGFVCLDTAKLPGIFKQIFSSKLLKDKL